MMNTASKIAMLFSVLLSHSPLLNAQKRNDIVGTWISSQRNVMVTIYADSSFFRGKVIWFDDSDDKSRPRNIRKDRNNPNKSLRNRKIIGIDVLRDLKYNPKCKCWQGGMIYDVQTGRTWNASITLENINKLKVRGFWHYEFIGKSMIFRRVKD